MEHRLTKAQLDQVIAEVQKLSQAGEEQLAIEQVREILRELNLPPELLEDALLQLQHQQALSLHQNLKRSIRVFVLAGTSLMLIIVLASTQQWQHTISRIKTQEGRITLTADDSGSSVNTVPRRGRSTSSIFYRVALLDAPSIGQALFLSCQWINPSGQIVDKSPASISKSSTRMSQATCEYNLRTNAPVGIWKVVAFWGDRPLNETTFNVIDIQPKPKQ